jgi:hypothetical protein
MLDARRREQETTLSIRIDLEKISEDPAHPLQEDVEMIHEIARAVEAEAEASVAVDPLQDANEPLP